MKTLLKILSIGVQEGSATFLADLEQWDEVELEVTDCPTLEAARQAVQQAQQTQQQEAQPFDVFLVDQQLDPGPDGLEQMLENLREISPNTVPIILAQPDDPDAGWRAYAAGAFRYLPKPVNPKELLWVFHAWEMWYRRYEDILVDVVEAIYRPEATADGQAAHDVREVEETANRIVDWGRRFDFKRARLWRFDRTEQKMIGFMERGNQGLQDFPGFPEYYETYAEPLRKSRRPVFYYARKHEALMDDRFGKEGFKPPAGLWVELPLWTSEGFWGTLALDNIDDRGPIPSQLRSILSLYGRLAGLLLDRARLYQEGKRLRAVLRIAQAGSRSTNLEEMRKSILSELRALFPGVQLFILTYNTLKDHLEFTKESLAGFYVIDNESEKERDHVDLNKDNSIAGRVAKKSIVTGEVTIENVSDVKKDYDYLDLHQDTQSEMCVSLMIDKKLYGILALESPAKHAFTNDDESLLEILGEYITLALTGQENAIE